ncbi:aldo/keto reductase [Archangium violaceum]|uniref:myxosortase-dependent M36 family metallopeptidase n=1 Tax=Archangium violaceum TaxID=83451 RepID=UPI002B27D1DA|nr:aldo/keto reductase [Archangium violaceum]
MTRLIFKWSSLALALASTSAAAHHPPNYEVLQDSPPTPGKSTKLLSAKASDSRVAHRDEQRDLPTFVWANKKASSTSPRSQLTHMKPEQAALEQLGDYLSLYGHKSLTESGANVTSVSRDASGVTIVTVAQQVDGVEVFRQALHVLLNANNELVALSGNLSPHVSANTSLSRSASLRYQLTAPQAISAAYRDLTGAALDGSLLEQLNVRAGNKDPYTHYQLASYARPLAEGLVIPARARRVFFPMPDGLLPAYYLELNTAHEEDSDADYYAYVVSAADGRLLMRKNLTAHADFSYRVWAETTPPYTPLDGPAGSVATPHPTGIPNTFDAPPLVPSSLITLQNAPFSRNDPWLANGATETRGNNVDAYADLTRPGGFSDGDLRASVTAPGVFDRTMDFSIQTYANPQQTQAAVTQLFYVNNWLHDWFYDVGFDEASGNAQHDNYGRGGLAHDALIAEAQDYSGLNNAVMTTPADGASPLMQMFIFNGPSTSEHDSYLEASAPAEVTGRYQVGLATFGPEKYDVSGEVVLTASGSPSTTTACSALTNAAEVAGKIALIDLGYCSFTQKVQNAQNAGAIGVIVAHNEDGPIKGMPGSAPGITIPSQLITRADGNKLRATIPGLTVRLHRELILNQDGALDNAIMAHEWGHYISSRLIWNSSGLTSSQSVAMGEGWADFHALLMMTRAEDIHVPSNANWNGAYGLGEYAMRGISKDSTFFSKRRVAYSADMTKNALTFRHIANGEALPDTAPIHPNKENAEVHNSGEIWATMLWDCYVSLLRAYPFQQAQQRMKQYLVNGYKLTPVAPTYLEARDALIAAAYAGDEADGRRFWEAFARRGAGVGAVAPARFSNDHKGVVESYAATADVSILWVSVETSSNTCDWDDILDNGETGLLRIKVRNLGPNRTEETLATVTASPSQGVILGNGGQVRLPALDVLEEEVVAVPVSIQGAATHQPLDIVVTTRQGSLSRPGDHTESLSLIVNYDERPASSRREDAESSNPPWTRTHDEALSNVDWITARQAPTDTNYRFFAQNVDGLSDMRLTTPPLTVSTTEPFVLNFKHAWDFETGATNHYDGAIIELSEDGGRTWVDVGTPLYNGKITTYADNPNPLKGRDAFVAKSEGFPTLIPATLDFGTAYAGKTVQLRFRVGSDKNTAATGWWLDDLEFSGITNTPFTSVLEEDNVCVHSPPPVITAGVDVKVGERTLQTLHGSATDPNGAPLTSAWKQLSGPTVKLLNADTLMPSFLTPEVTANTDLVFQLSVSGSSTVTDTVTVTVTNVNRAPTVNAGVTGVVDERASYTLMGSASDEDGDSLTYSWVQQSGTLVALTNALTSQATFVAPEVNLDETLTFLLWVSDGQTTTHTSVEVVVRAVNHAPTARAGEAGSAESGAQVQLNGALSTDPDGDALTYEWAQVEGPAVTLSGADTATPSFTAPEVENQTELRFSLVVKDGSLSSEPTFVTVTITPKPHQGCSATGAGTPVGLLGLTLLALVRHRRQPATPHGVAHRARRLQPEDYQRHQAHRPPQPAP